MSDTGVYVDLDKEFYKKVRKFCIDNDVKVKDFVLIALREMMKNDTTTKITKRTK